MKKRNQIKSDMTNSFEKEKSQFLLQNYFEMNKEAIIDNYDKETKQRKQKHFILIIEQWIKTKDGKGISYESYIIPVSDTSIVNTLSKNAKKFVLNSVKTNKIVLVHASPNGMVNTAIFDRM